MNNGCGPAQPKLPTDSLNPNILPESQSPARDYDCQTGPRFNRERVRSEIADYVLLMLGAPVIQIELDVQQLSLVVDEALRIFEEWAPMSYFQYYHFTTTAGQSIYEMPCDIGLIRQVHYMPPSCDGATELGGGQVLGWIGDTGYGAGGLSWGAWGYNRNQPYWGYAGEWQLFKQYEDMFERMSSRNGAWEFFENDRTVKLYPTPHTGNGRVSVHYLQKKKDWSMTHQWMNEYALALGKIIVGRIRSKYSTLLSPGSGVTLDGATILAEGLAEKKQLEQDLVYKFQEPIPIIIG